MIKSLSSGLEDYIETIYVSSLNNEQLKGADLARKLNITRASVSEALSKLVSKELVKYSKCGSIILTEHGVNEAQKVYVKHHILKNFFEKVLGISSEEASVNACKIEHIISENILDKMESFTKEFSRNT